MRNGETRRRLCAAVAGLGLAAAACGESAEVETAAARGEKVYRNVCATCHGADPNVDGVLGPAIAGASAELVRARIVEGGYPEGYTPKRNTRQMTALPHLEPVVPDLVAYLAEAKR